MVLFVCLFVHSLSYSLLLCIAITITIILFIIKASFVPTNTFLDYIKSLCPAHPSKSSYTPCRRPCSLPVPSTSDSALLSTPIQTRTRRKERSPSADPKPPQGSFETSLRATRVQEADRRSRRATYREASHRSTHITLLI